MQSREAGLTKALGTTNRKLFNCKRIAEGADRFAGLGVLVVLMTHDAFFADYRDGRHCPKLPFSITGDDLLKIAFAFFEGGNSRFFEGVFGRVFFSG